MAALSSPGIGSGLDVNALVSKLMSVEQKPLTLLATKETTFNSKLSAYGSLKSALSTLQSAGYTLATPSTFTGRSTSLSDTTIMTATAATAATEGTYAINVTTLATNRTVRSDTAYAATTDTFNLGTLNIAVDGGAPVAVTIDATNNTLDGIRGAINAASAGVTATVVNDGTTNRLVLTAKNTGLDGDFTVAVTDSGAGGTNALNLLDYAGGAGAATKFVSAQTPVDADLTVNGLQVIRSSNTFTDVISGVTMNLTKAGTTSLTVSRNTAAVTTAVTTFVTAYNAVNKLLHDTSAYNASTGKASILTGDGTVRNIQSQLTNLVGTSLTGLSGGIASLNDIGITLQKDGSLATNSTKLQAALDDTSKDVAGLFSKTTTGNEGVAVRLNTVLDSIIGAEGQMTGRTKGIDNSLKDIAKQKTTLQARLTAIEARYRKQFTSLDTLLASLQQTTSYLTQQLESLAKQTASR